MSMTADERREWAHDRLNNYLRDVEISEFLNELGHVSHLEDRVCNLESAVEDHDQQLDNLSHDVTNLERRAESIEEEIDSLAS